MIYELLINGKELISLEEDFYTIGRSKLCSIIIPEKTLSRFHCVLAKVKDKCQITDGCLKTGKPSVNGTVINGKKLNSKHGYELRNGDEISLSVTIKIKFFCKEVDVIDVDSTLL